MNRQKEIETAASTFTSDEKISRGFKCGAQWADQNPVKYRPFKDSEEAFRAMLNHEPKGWIKSGSHYYFICELKEDKVFTDEWKKLSSLFDNYKFADGTPFGKID